MKYLLVILLAGCYVIPSLTSPTGRIPKCKNHLLVSGKMPKRFADDLQKAMDIWNNHLHTQAFSMTYPSDVQRLNDGLDTVTWTESGYNRNPEEEAHTDVLFTNGYATENDIEINAENFTYYSQFHNGKQIHFESLMVHELGHILGYDHFDDPTSVMQPVLLFNTVRLGVLPLGNIKCH